MSTRLSEPLLAYHAAKNTLAIDGMRYAFTLDHAKIARLEIG